MAYELNEGQGSIFPNQKQNERQPDFRGSILIKGQLYDLSCWNHVSKNGKEYISLNAQPHVERQQAPAQEAAAIYPPRQARYSQPAQGETLTPQQEDLPF